MRFFLSFLLMLGAWFAQAQPKQNSSYSRFGLGDYLPQYYASQSGMAGLSVAHYDGYHLNPLNPASYAQLRAATFETGLYGKFSHYEQASDQTFHENWSGNISYFALGFTMKSPINEVLDKVKSRWRYGMGFNLSPYTLVGYDIESSDTLSSGDPVNTVFEGTGGTYKFGWNIAAKRDHTAAGLSLGWLFGKSIFENTTDFTTGNIINDFQNNFRDEISLRGLVWSLGVQHDIILARDAEDKSLEKRWLTIGMTGESNHKVNSDFSLLRLRSRGKLTNGEYEDVDTLLAQLNQTQKVTLPATLGIGIQYVKLNKLKLGAQFNYESWSAYENNARPAKMRNTVAVSAGLEYIPDYISYNRYFSRTRYRAGAYFRQDPRIINNEKLDDVGVTVGIGFPIQLPRQQISFVNLGLETGLFGANTAISEQYFRINLGFTLNDNTWFYKRRFE
ncbi:MAG: hypothetical protein IT269_07450 [Saprospiraceae bacterium]|nr:hypothetical protein [Saprospiraceae bacterium]